MAIKNKSDLKYYIKKDRERNKLNHPLLQTTPNGTIYHFYIFIDSATDALQEKITYLSHLIQLGGEYSSCIQVSEE